MDRISISRFKANYKTDKAIEITIVDDDGKLVYQGEMTLSDFADCITGRVDCNIERVLGVEDGRD